MREICEALDNGNANKSYTRALHKQIEAIRDPELTASAKMLSVMHDEKLSITDLTLQKSQSYTRYFQSAALDESVRRNLDFQAKASLEQQERLNTMNEISFDKYLSNYFSTDTAAGKVHSQDQGTPYSVAGTSTR